MNTKSRIQADMKEALKSGEKEKLSVIRMLFTEIRNAEINDTKEPGRVRTEEESLKILTAYHKSLTKTLAEFPENRRAPLEFELSVLEQYLPKQLNKAELEVEIQKFLQSTDNRNFGLLMKDLNLKLQGKVDGKLLSETLKSQLALSEPK